MGAKGEGTDFPHGDTDDLPEGALGGAAVLLCGIPEGCVDPEPGVFLTPQWLAGELEADDDLAKGLVDRFQDEESFLATLEADQDRTER